MFKPSIIGPDDKGRFRIGELPAGEWSVVVRRSGDPTTLYQDQVTVDAGQTKELKIETKELKVEGKRE